MALDALVLKLKSSRTRFKSRQAVSGSGAFRHARTWACTLSRQVLCGIQDNAQKMGLTSLPRNPLELANGPNQAGMAVGDDQIHPRKPRVFNQLFTCSHPPAFLAHPYNCVKIILKKSEPW
jgi:hypothetical protein